MTIKTTERVLGIFLLLVSLILAEAGFYTVSYKDTCDLSNEANSMLSFNCFVALTNAVVALIFGICLLIKSFDKA